MRIEPFPFFSQHLTARQIEAMLAGPVARSECLFGLVRRAERPARSLMPLRSGLSRDAGQRLMDGAFTDPDSGNLLIIAGKTEIIETKFVKLDDSDVLVTTVRKTPQALVKALDVTASLEAGELVLYDMR